MGGSAVKWRYCDYVTFSHDNGVGRILRLNCILVRQGRGIEKFKIPPHINDHRTAIISLKNLTKHANQ